MTNRSPQHLIPGARLAAMPEFRTAHRSFGRAYSGPEQRRRTAFPAGTAGNAQKRNGIL